MTLSVAIIAYGFRSDKTKECVYLELFLLLLKKTSLTFTVFFLHLVRRKNYTFQFFSQKSKTSFVYFCSSWFIYKQMRKTIFADALGHRGGLSAAVGDRRLRECGLFKRVSPF